MSRVKKNPVRHWTGPERSYDLIFEGTLAVLVVAVLVVAAALMFGSANGGLTYPGGPPSKAGDSFTALAAISAAGPKTLPAVNWSSPACTVSRIACCCSIRASAHSTARTAPSKV